MENGLIFIPANSKILYLTVEKAKNGFKPRNFKRFEPFYFLREKRNVLLTVQILMSDMQCHNISYPLG